jgi:choline-sulfatase
MQDIENNPPPGVPPGRLGLFNWADYYSKIAHLDNEVGMLLDALDESGQATNTYVFFTSDNGLTSTELEQPGKGTWYDESARVLACGRGPGIAPGTDVTTPMVSVDWLPTFLEIAGIPVPPALEGKSMIPALQGGTPLRATAYGEVSANSFPHWQMVRSYTGVSAGYKYVYSVALDEEHLYHLDADPFEETDIIGSAPQAVLDELRQMHQSWLAATP